MKGTEKKELGFSGSFERLLIKGKDL